MKPEPVPRVGRVLDLVAAVLFLAGAALYARSWIGMRELAAGQPELGMRVAALLRHSELLGLARVGVGLMAAGIIAAVTAALVARRLARTRATQEPAQ